MMPTLTKTPWFRAIALYGLITCPLLGAEETSLAEILDSINRKEEIGAQLKALSALPKEALVHRKLENTLLTLLTDPTLTKSQRLETLNLSRELSLTKEALSQDKLANTLLKLEPSLTSPNLKFFAIDCLLQFDALESSTIQSNIASLKQTIIADAAKSASKQRYSATLHAACLKTVGGPKTKSTVISTIVDLLAEDREQPPTLKLALYQAVIRLCSTNPSAFKKSHQVDLAKSLVAELSKHPALSTAGANKTESENLLALLPAVGHLLRRDLGTGPLTEGTQALLKTLEHPDQSILRSGGMALLAIANQNLSKSDLKIEDQLIKASKSPSFKGDEATNRLRVFADLLVLRFQNLVHHDDIKDAEKKVEKCLNFFYELFNAPNISIKQKGMDGFFVLEPSVFKTKTIDSKSKKIIKDFVRTCVDNVMGNKEFEASLPPSFFPRMAEVLHEISGQDFGTEKKLWSNWMRTEGQTFFK